jgi:hypothetical protein
LVTVTGLHTDTRVRWGQLQPDKFVGTVLYGTLREKIKMAYMVISVYTQIIHSLPGTASLKLCQPPPGGPDDVLKLRDLLKHMRACITDANDIIQGDNPTLPVSAYTPEGYILQMTRDIRRYVNLIHRWASAIENDPAMELAILPGLNGKRAGDVATDILKHIAEIVQILDFAQSYAEQVLQLAGEVNLVSI